MKKLKHLKQLLITDKLLDEEKEQERINDLHKQISKLEEDEKYNLQHNKLQNKFGVLK
jgi:hypothetical protein